MPWHYTRGSQIANRIACGAKIIYNDTIANTGIGRSIIMETKDRLNIYIPVRLKRRVKEIADDKDMKMNDLVIKAIADMVDRMDADYSAPDLVYDRMGQLLNSQMTVITALNEANRKLDEITND